MLLMKLPTLYFAAFCATASLAMPTDLLLEICCLASLLLPEGCTMNVVSGIAGTSSFRRCCSRPVQILYLAEAGPGARAEAAMEPGAGPGTTAGAGHTFSHSRATLACNQAGKHGRGQMQLQQQPPAFMRCNTAAALLYCGAAPGLGNLQP